MHDVIYYLAKKIETFFNAKAQLTVNRVSDAQRTPREGNDHSLASPNDQKNVTSDARTTIFRLDVFSVYDARRTASVEERPLIASTKYSKKQIFAAQNFCFAKRRQPPNVTFS